MGTLAFLHAISLIAFATASNFNPRSYEASSNKIATCDAINRTLSPSSTGTGFDVVNEERVQIQLHYVDVNPAAETTILMVHGWPADWSTWGYQIEEFKDDYRLIVPSLRGFGKSTHPGNVRSSGALFDIVNDLDCILKHAGIEKAICMGHDWGSQICYEAARSRPDITSAVIGVTIPYLPAGATLTHVSELTKYFPRLMYHLYFDEKMDEAIEELGKDVRRSLRATYKSFKNPSPSGFLRSKDTYLQAYDGHEISPIGFLTPEEEDYLVEQFTRHKFKYNLQFYTTESRYQSWKFARDQGNLTLPQPVLTVYPSKDAVADWRIFAQYTETKKYIPNWTTETVTGAHWIHLEDPEGFNKIVRQWLTKLREGDVKQARPVDEL